MTDAAHSIGTSKRAVVFGRLDKLSRLMVPQSRLVGGTHSCDYAEVSDQKNLVKNNNSVAEDEVQSLKERAKSAHEKLDEVRKVVKD